jgi:hypothetical protein
LGKLGKVSEKWGVKLSNQTTHLITDKLDEDEEKKHIQLLGGIIISRKFIDDSIKLNKLCNDNDYLIN